MVVSVYTFEVMCCIIVFMERDQLYLYAVVI